MLAFAAGTVRVEPENLTGLASARLTLCLPHVMKKPRSLSLPGLPVNSRGTQMPRCCYGSPTRARTWDPAVNSRLLYQLSYRGSIVSRRKEAQPANNLANRRYPENPSIMYIHSTYHGGHLTFGRQSITIGVDRFGG